MRQIAFLTSANMLADAPDARADQFEFELEFGALRAGAAHLGFELSPMVWNDPDADWSTFDAAVIGTTWDYWDKAATFLETLERIEVTTPVFNPSRLVRWNIDKLYLKGLYERGAPAIDTLWAEAADEAHIAAAFARFEGEHIIVKPRISAGAWRLAKLARGAPLPPAILLPPGACLIQPYLPAIETFGEISVMAYDGVVSHAVRKVPKSGDFRVQSNFGAREVEHQLTPDLIAQATRVLEAVGEPLLYARIDFAPGLDGDLKLIELEIIEPYHYPEQGPDCGDRFAAGLARRR